MKFRDLGIKEKAAVIKLGVGGGLHTLQDIEQFWDGMQGPDDPPVVQKVNKSKADFVQRLKDKDRAYIQDWENPNYIATHKLSWAEDDNGAIVYPNVQNVNGKLVDFSRPPYNIWAGYDNAVKNGDTVRMTPQEAEWFTTHYKDYYPGFNEYKKGGPKKKLKSPEQILAEKYSIEPITADNTNFVQQPVFTPQEKSYAAAQQAFYERHRSPETEEKALSDTRQAVRDARQAAKDWKAAEFGTLDTPQSTDLQYAWRRFKNAKGSELLYPLPGIGEAMFGVDVADKLYSGNYGDAVKDLALYGTMTYASEIANWVRNNIGIYRATRLTKEGEAFANQYFDFDRVAKERNALSGNNFFHGTNAKEGNNIWKAGSIDPNVTQGMYVSFGEVWPEHAYMPNMYVFPENTFGLRVATDYRGNIRNELVNDVGRKKLGINSVMQYNPGNNWYTERYIDADGNKFTNFDMTNLFDIYNSNQTVIPEDVFRSAISKSNYKIHKVSPDYKQSSLIEYNPNLGRRFKLSFTEDDHGQFIDDWINNKTTMFSKGGSIHIKPKNRGKFNATKKRTGKTTEELTHSKNPLTRKRAIFAQNARKWHHKHPDGGSLIQANIGPEWNMPDYFAQSLILGPMYGFGYVPPRQLDHNDLRNRQLYLESEGDIRAGSNKGAAGLFQIMPNTLQWYQDSTGHIGDVFDPVYNESVRDWALQKNYNSDWAKYGNPTDEGRWARAYAAYNYGASNLGKAIRKAEREGIDVVNGDGWMTYLPDETKGYVNFIMNSIDSSRYKTQENYNTWLNSGNPYIK